MLRKSMVVGVACAAMVCPAARADTLVLSDGRKLTGAVTAEGETYTVKTRFGDVTVNKADVSDWQRDDGGPAATAPAPPATAPPTSDPATQKGIDALAAGDFSAARDLFADALRHDPRDARAAHGLGLAYLKLGDVVRARDLLAQALRDSPAPPDHALTINAAAVELAAGNAMRAVRIARDYLAAHPGDVDEPVLDAMGIALNLTDDRTRAAAAYREAADFYETYQSKLEAAHPGQKRWGIHWLPAAEVKRKHAHPMTAQREKLRALHDAEALAEKRVSVAQAQLERVQKASGTGGSNVESELARRTLADAEAKRDAARAAAQAAGDERAPFPDHIETVALDEPAPGAGPPPQAKRAAPVEAPPAVIADAGPATSGPAAATAPSPASPASPAVDAAPSGPQYAAAFPVAPDLLLTAARPLRNAKRVTVTGGDGIPQKAVLLRADDATTGLALLKVDGVKLSPLAFHPAFTGGPVDCAAFPTLDVFSPSAAIIHGTAAAAPAPPPAGAAKEAWTVKLEQDPRLPGAPLLAGGRVVGIELGAADGAVEKVPAVSAARAAAFVGADLAPGESSADPCGVMMQVTVTHEKD